MQDRSASRDPSPSELRDIRDKHARIAALRDAHEREGRAEEPPRAELASLAARWPGALRELDDLPRDVLAARLAELDAALASGGPVAPWARAQIAFHALARGALSAKRWLAGRHEIDDGIRRAFEETFRGDEEALAWSDRLDEVARPPRGRVLSLVWSALAARLELDVATAKDLVLDGGLRSGRR